MNSLEKLAESGLYKIGQPLKLHLGCGQTHLFEYVNIDFPQSEHNVMISAADAEADITKDLKFPENSVDEIRSHHVFEHFSRVTALAQLIKWHRWLKVDGILIIEVPDFMTSIDQIMDPTANYSDQMAIIRHLTGDQSSDWGFHVDQWFDARFETTLSAFGFHIVEINKTKWEVWPHLASITVNAVKLSNKSIKEQIEIANTLLKDSMVSEREVKTYEVWKIQLLELLEGI